MAHRFGLTISPLPLALEVPPVAMVWSSRTDRDPATVWLREQVRACSLGAEVWVAERALAVA